MGKALGLVETLGLIGAIEAADAGLKSANVTLIDKELSTGGYVTVKFEGDVSSVKAAVEAASVAAEKVSQLIASHVIARTSDELDKVKYNDEEMEKADIVKIEIEEIEEIEEEKIDQVVDIENEKVENQQVLVFRDKRYNLHGPDGIDQLKVVDLRNLARSIEITTMSKQEIKFAKKDELLSAIKGHYNGGE